jgi:hypothetical protein
MKKKSSSKKRLKASVVEAIRVVPTPAKQLLKQDFLLLEKGLPKAVEGLTSRFIQAAIGLAISLLQGHFGDATFFCFCFLLGSCVLGAAIAYLYSSKRREEYMDALKRIKAVADKSMAATP